MKRFWTESVLFVNTPIERIDRRRNPRYGAKMLMRRGLQWILAAGIVATSLWVGGTKHPLYDGWHRGTAPPEAVPAMEDFLAQVDQRLDDDVELALWWTRRGNAHLRTMGHWWAAASYQLAPRRVYPLLSVEEAEGLPRLAPDLRSFLIERSEALAEALSEGSEGSPIAVASWGPPTPCDVPPFPRLVPVFEAYVGCLSLPPPYLDSVTSSP